MWFIGLLVGIMVGAAFESFSAAMIFGAIGAVLAILIKEKMGSPRRPGPEVRTTFDDAEKREETLGLQRRVEVLEQRLAELERHVALGASAPSLPVPASLPSMVEPPKPLTERLDDAPPVPARPAIEALPGAMPHGTFARNSTSVPAPSADESAIESLGEAQALQSAQVAPSEVPAFEPFVPNAVAPSSDEPAFNEASTPEPEPVAAPPARPAFVPRPPAVPLRDRLPAPLRNLIFGGNMLVKLGVLILFLGLAFLLRYTAERVTVPVELRYAGVALAGGVLLALGWFLRRKRAGYALILQGAGIGVFYLTTLAAMKLSELLPPTAGFGFLFAVAVLSAVLAVAQNAPVLAIVAALEGFAAPVLASTGNNNAVGLFGYLLVLDIGIFLVAWFKAWRLLNLIGLTGTFTLASGWANRYYSPDQYGTVQPFLIAFFVLFALIGLLFARRTLADAPEDDKVPLAERAVATLRRVGRVDSSLVFGAPMAAFGLQYLLARQLEFGPAFSALGFGAFYLAMGWFVLATQPRGLRLLAEAYAIVGVIFATLAIPLGFEGQWTGAAWAVEAAGMYWLGARQARPYARMFALALLAGAVVQLLRSIGMDGAPGEPLLQGSYFGPVLVAGGAFAMWALQLRARLHETAKWEAIAASVLPWVGMAALTLLPWMLLPQAWAAVATAFMAVASYSAALRPALAGMRPVAYAMQALAFLAVALTLHGGAEGQPLLEGPVLAVVFVGIALLLTWAQYLRAAGALESSWEKLASTALPWAGMAAFTLVPWLTLTQVWAPAAAAWLALAVYLVALRFELSTLRSIVHAIQAVAVVALVAGLQPGNPGDAALASGWQGMVAAAMVAFSVLATGAWSLRRAHIDALAIGEPPTWSMVQVVSLLVGVSLLHLTMLFGLSLAQAAYVWPFTAIIVLWVALRVAHRPLAALGGALHAAAAILFVFWTEHGTGDPRAFANTGFWTPLALGLTGLVAADWLRAQARFAATALAGERAAPVKRWVNAWCAQPVVLWASLGWGAGWWLVAALGESVRVLLVHGRQDCVPAAIVGVVTLSSIVATVVAARRDWRELGLGTAATLPALVIAAGFGLTLGVDVPSTGWGWLAWPLALAWHLRLLHAQQRWLPSKLQSMLHVAGLWFFLLLGARECQWQLGSLGDALSAWPLLGWVVVPVAVLWALRSEALLRRWPLGTQRRAYLELALPPVALYLLCWALLTNVLSSGNASPLPFVPLLNPLELAQWLVLLAVVLWWKALPTRSPVRIAPTIVHPALAVTGWFLLTGAVLRACHHYAGVDWAFDAFYASTLTQAALSIVWAICGVLAMVLGHRRASRMVWLAGAALLGVVVLKLFFVELADRGGLFRIVSFIGVGILLLLVGYFAPVPPSRASRPAARHDSPPSEVSE